MAKKRKRRPRAAATPAPQPAATPAKAPRKPIEEERPPAPWGSFPLVEVVVLVALVMLVAGVFVRGSQGATLLVTGLALGSLAGLELSIREHFAGYRSHTTLLAGACAFASMAIVFFAGGRGDVSRALMLPVGGLVFLGSFWALREAFKRRSGGLGFR